MNPDLFNLRQIKAPRLDSTMLQRAVSRIGMLTEGWEGGGTASFAGLLDEFRKRMRSALLNGQSFEQCTNGRRREWLLLSLYLNDLGTEESRAWLPPLDENVAVSILGEDPNGIKRHLRRLATQLYFTHFGLKHLPCLDWLAEILRLAWKAADPKQLDAAGLAWRLHADELFCNKAPDEVAKYWQEGMTVSQLAQSCHIPEGDAVKFRDRLFEAVVLKRIREMPLNSSNQGLNEIVIAEKERILRTGRPLGSAAVQILVKRSQNENSSIVPEIWSEQLVTYACDPRIPNSEMQQRWWGWATSSEKDVAIRALSKISLEEFIRLLEKSLAGTPQGHQFPARRNLLQKLFDKGLVIDARLVVSSRIYQGLNTKTKEILDPSWLRGSQDTSFVCLRCTNDVYLIEGTHSFSLRGFIGEDLFPIKGYWKSASRQYLASQFRVDERACQIYQEHRGRYWAWEFIQKLRRRHIEWEIFR